MYKGTVPILEGGFHLPPWNVVVSYLVWLLATRTLKLAPHLWYRPQDVIYVPAFILFGYYFAIMKIYALFMLHEVDVLSFPTHCTANAFSQTAWGTRAGIGDPTAATAAADKQPSTNDPEKHATSSPMRPRAYSAQYEGLHQETFVMRNDPGYAW